MILVHTSEGTNSTELQKLGETISISDLSFLSPTEPYLYSYDGQIRLICLVC